MKLTTHKKLILLFGLTCLPHSLQAADPACSNLGGAVILKDTIYGSLAGGILGGLVVLAADSQKAGQATALGGAIGGVLGAGFGIYESSVKICTTPIIESPKKPTTYELRPTLSKNTIGVNFKYYL